MIKIILQKLGAQRSDDDVIRITKDNEYGIYNVSVTCFNGSGTTSTAQFDLDTLYEYIDNLLNVFLMDTPGMDGTTNLTAQFDISGFPTFLLSKEALVRHRDELNRAIEFWAEA